MQSQMELVLIIAALASTFAEPCGDITCTSDETCCKDYPGAIEDTECCITMVEDCVAVRPPFMTSTCCPRWTVGCTVGSVGCCDPAKPWQTTTAATSRTSTRRSRATRHKSAVQAREDVPEEFDSRHRKRPSSGVNFTGYALFPIDSMVTTRMDAFTFDAFTGEVLAKNPVTGPFAQYYTGYYGESTRVFAFDAHNRSFYLAEQYDASARSGGPPTSSPLVVFTIDAATGASSVAHVSGCEGGYPVGQAWDDELQRLVVGVQNRTSASFCAIRPSSGEGTPFGTIDRGASRVHASAHHGALLFSTGTIDRGASEASDAYYSAYISHVGAGVAVRVGHRLVTSGAQPGKATTVLDPSGGGRALNTSFDPVDWGAHGLPATLQPYPNSGYMYISLAPRLGVLAEEGYDILGWGAPGMPPTVLANLSNAHPPDIPISNAPLGYVQDAVATAWDGTQMRTFYGAMTVARNGKEGLEDKWQVSTYDLLHGGRDQTVALVPQPSPLGAETSSLSGFGLVLHA